MRFDPIEVKDKEGRAIIIRSAELSDAEELITFLKKTADLSSYPCTPHFYSFFHYTLHQP